MCYANVMANCLSDFEIKKKHYDLSLGSTNTHSRLQWNLISFSKYFVINQSASQVGVLT